MNTSPPELSRTKITAGSFTSPHIQQLAASHPFTQQQIDVVFPSSDSFEGTLSNLDTRFAKGKSALSDSYGRSINVHKRGSEALYLSTDEIDDRWCIDPRGVLTLCITKDTYQRLGLVGNRLPFKGCAEQYVIRIPLRDNSESVGMKAKRKKALQDWDRRREEDGLGKWGVIHCWSSVDGFEKIVDFGDSQQCEVKPQIHKSSVIHIPIPSSTWTTWPQKSNSDNASEWNESMNALFEWVGMACLGAQRLEVNDRVDPYVGVYSPPNPSRTGTITHLRWRGLLSPAFVQLIVNSAISPLSKTADPSSSFVSITAHAFSTSPVTYIPPGAEPGGTGREAPLRVPRNAAEHCWSLILVMMGQDNETGQRSWVMAETVGKWDMRWG
ncbi:hypothetical protein PILCRDRAFT_60188 [Piloderma croceum F 1598]|uniref:Uncharacterized protein n=1 Tax=Piloderma croceum (strain F 1598) TaxID=765440 RepID=A0A0C3BV05_PILCF|nr:hypothetical protein PILCRDRAFT_60188 [Piloderma croceum F 1598]